MLKKLSVAVAAALLASCAVPTQQDKQQALLTGSMKAKMLLFRIKQRRLSKSPMPC